EAVHMAMSRIAREFGTLPTDRTIVCVCHVGARSAAVAAALNEAGWHAVNLEGGMAAWEAAGLPRGGDERRTGDVARAACRPPRPSAPRWSGRAASCGPRA